MSQVDPIRGLAQRYLDLWERHLIGLQNAAPMPGTAPLGQEAANRVLQEFAVKIAEMTGKLHDERE